jgi:hypothetical protein
VSVDLIDRVDLGGIDARVLLSSNAGTKITSYFLSHYCTFVSFEQPLLVFLYVAFVQITGQVGSRTGNI